MWKEIASSYPLHGVTVILEERIHISQQGYAYHYHRVRVIEGSEEIIQKCDTSTQAFDLYQGLVTATPMFDSGNF